MDPLGSKLCAVWLVLCGVRPIQVPLLVAMRLVVCVVAAFVMLASWLASAPMAAAAGWSIQRTLEPAVPLGHGHLEAVSCTSGTACVAVGQFTRDDVNSGGVRWKVLVERWNGSSWFIQPTPELPAAYVAGTPELRGVSCASSTDCVAVGDLNVDDPAHDRALIERWNGSRWSIEPTSDPSSGSTVLRGVSCTTKRVCTAVGSAGSGTLAERWNGTAWTIQAAPNPSSAGGSLASVSCTSETACVAVGSTGSRALAERWNGNSWTIQPTPGPAGATSFQFHGVSCTSKTVCVAVGHFENRTGGWVLAEHWNGSRWTIMPTGAGARRGSLNSVSCASKTTCIAVGSAGSRTLAESWNGSRRWTIRSGPDPTGAIHPPDPSGNYTESGSSLLSVSCASMRSCAAVGPYTMSNPANCGFDRCGVDLTDPLAERWNGTRWMVHRAQPVVVGRGDLEAVSCSSPTVCTAVGSFADRFGIQESLAERWMTTKWTVQSTPDPAGALLHGVSCSSPKACEAVGQLSLGSIFDTLAERWSGTSWEVQSASPAGDTTYYPPTELNDVSCSSPKDCIAVGQFDAGGESRALAERWTRGRWMTQSVPNPTLADLIAVSCPSPTSCEAVGDVQNNQNRIEPLEERWNGKTWTIQPTPGLAGSVGVYLNDVSCSSPTACTAVGVTVYDNPFRAPPLVERWNGRSWTIQPTPGPASSVYPSLNGVSCPSLTACTAVGSNGKATLAERWNGSTWTIQPTPNPAGATLKDVSCTSPNACIAVGSRGDTQLVERYS